MSVEANAHGYCHICKRDLTREEGRDMSHKHQMTNTPKHKPTGMEALYEQQGAEYRRLKALNEELLTVCKYLVDSCTSKEIIRALGKPNALQHAVENAQIVIAKAEGK